MTTDFTLNKVGRVTYDRVGRRSVPGWPFPTANRAQISEQKTYTSDVHLEDDFEGYQPSLHAIQETTIALQGDLTLSTDISVRSHGPRYADYPSSWESIGQGGWGGGCPAWGTRHATLIGDGGSQTLNIKSQTTSISDQTVRAYGFDGSTIKLGPGNDTITTDVIATAGTDYTLFPRNYLWDKGTSYEPVYAYGSAHAYGAIASTIDTGNGDDIVQLLATGKKYNSAGAPHHVYEEKTIGNAITLHSTDLLTGVGNDIVEIKASSDGTREKAQNPNSMYPDWYNHTYYETAVYQSTIDLGKGDDEISIETRNLRFEERYGHLRAQHFGTTSIDQSSIHGGPGSDTIKITAGLAKDSTISGGAGYDILELPISYIRANRLWKSKFERIEGADTIQLPWGSNVIVKDIEEIRFGGNKFMNQAQPPIREYDNIAEWYAGSDSSKIYWLRKDTIEKKINVIRSYYKYQHPNGLVANDKYIEVIKGQIPGHTGSSYRVEGLKLKFPGTIDFYQSSENSHAFDFRQGLWTYDDQYIWNEEAEQIGVPKPDDAKPFERTEGDSTITVYDNTFQVGGFAESNVVRRGDLTKELQIRVRRTIFRDGEIVSSIATWNKFWPGEYWKSIHGDSKWGDADDEYIDKVKLKILKVKGEGEWAILNSTAIAKDPRFQSKKIKQPTLTSENETSSQRLESVPRPNPTTASGDQVDNDGVMQYKTGKGLMRGIKGGNVFAFSKIQQFRRSYADIIINFRRKQGDKIQFADSVLPDLGSGESIKFAVSCKPKSNRILSKEDVDLVYFKPKGRLFYNGNGTDKGWGDRDQGGLVAILKGCPSLTSSDIVVGDI